MATVGSVATALPANRLSQRELRSVASAMLASTASSSGLLEVFDNARIDERAIAMPVAWYLEPHGFKDRSQAYIRVALELAEEASRSALDAADIAPRDVAAIIVVSSTGIATPSLDARLCNRLGMAPGVVRLPIWGLGCAGGVAGLQRAAELAQAHSGPVLLVAVELCTLSFDLDRVLAPKQAADKRAMIAAGIFGDGAAAVVVQPGDSGLRYIAGASHLFPDTERVMGWDVENHNLDVVLSPGIPNLVRSEAAGIVKPFLARHGLTAPDHWVLHPGGAKVITAYQEALGLSDADLRYTLETLRRHGNMSSPTVLFALQQAQDAIRPGETALLGALGPGFASELALLRA